MMNLYSYLLELFLFFFFIILNTTLSANIRPTGIASSLGKQETKPTSGTAAEDKWQNAIDIISNLPPPSQPQAQLAKEIEGLYLIKQYLFDFGYLQQSEPFNNILDQQTISAIKNYQQYFNLQVTGDLNKQTLQQISLPRCGVPDMNFKFGFTNNFSWPKGNNWFPKGTKFLTYGFAPESKIPLNMINVFANAFTIWSQTTKVMTFTETFDYEDADIKIGFYLRNDEVEEVVNGDTLISLQHNSGVMSGVLQLYVSKYWALPTDNYTLSYQNGVFDLETAVMHQIGHILGLDHSSEEESVMYPTILPSQQRKVQITVSDNLAIQQIYTTATKATATNAKDNGGCFTIFGYSYGLFTSLLLGFAFVALLT